MPRIDSHPPDCERCQPILDDEYAAIAYDQTDCETCDGKGVINGEHCKKCSGRGFFGYSW
jgi:DnaJ-class molecular chaperone